MLITSGHTERPIKALQAGAVATWFMPGSTPRAARKQWIAGTLQPRGTVTVDEFIAYYDAYGKDAESARKSFETINRGAPQMTKSRLLEIMEEFHFSEDANAPGNFVWGPF